MNILYAANGYVDRGIPTNGFPMYLYKVAHALKDLGHTPVIVYCSNRDSYRIEDGIKIYGIKCRIVHTAYSWLNAFFSSICKSYYLNKRLKELIKREDIDVIQFTSLNAISLLYNGKTPAIMRLSSYTKKQNPTFDSTDRYTILMASLLEILAGKRCQAVFAPSNVMAEAFQKDFGKRVHVIETPYIQDIKVQDDSFYDTHLKGKKYILFFGRIYYAKGITVIAEILEKFLERHKDYYFVFVGDVLPVNGKSSIDIIADGAGKCKKQVLIFKSQEHSKLYPVIEHSEFVVLPSIIDNFPNSCIEAMALSKVVIGTNGASFEQLIVHQQSGLLCKIGDAKDLLEKMEIAAAMSKQEKQAMEKRAQESITKLRPEIVVKKLLRFYDAVIEM